MTERDRRFLDRERPWENPPAPGPTVVVDIDGPLAKMDAYTHLIAAPRPQERDWMAFHRHFRDAAPNRAGGRVVRALAEAGYTIAYSTTRLDNLMFTTDQWIRHRSLPPGHIEPRSFWHDGTVRPALDVKRRHWWRWADRYEAASPVVAWIDDEPDAAAMLLRQGCPAWMLADLLEYQQAGDLLAVVERGPRPAAELASARASARRAFEEAEDRRRPRHTRWQQGHVARLAQRRREERRALGKAG